MPADRSRLAAAQGELVRALTGAADVPQGFNAKSVALAARGLAAKRREQAAHAWPEMAKELGPAFNRHFAKYASEHALPSDGPQPDALAFVRWLDLQSLLSRQSERMLLAKESMIGFPIRWRRLKDGGGWAVAVRKLGLLAV